LFETAKSAAESRYSRAPRVLLRTVLASLAAGDAAENILTDFPSLKADDVRAAIAFAAASPRRTFPSRLFPISNEKPSSTRTCRCKSQLVSESLDTMFIRPNKKSLGLRRFRTLGTRPARRPHSHYTGPGFLGQPSLHSWYPSRCRAGSVALTQPTAIGGTLGRGISGRSGQRVGGVLCCRDRSEDSCAPHPEPTDLSLPLDYVEPLHCDPDNPRVWNTRMRIWPSMSCIIKDCAHEKNHTSIRGKK